MISTRNCHHLVVWLGLISALLPFALRLTENQMVLGSSPNTQDSSLGGLSQYAVAKAPMVFVWIIWTTLLGKRAVPLLVIATIAGISDKVLMGFIALPLVALAGAVAPIVFMVAGVVVLVGLVAVGIVALPLLAMYFSPLVTTACLGAVLLSNVSATESLLNAIPTAYMQLQRATTNLVLVVAARKTTIASVSNDGLFRVSDK